MRASLWERLFPSAPRSLAARYFALGVAMLALGGVMALNLRWSLAYGARPTPLLGGLLYGRTGGGLTQTEYTSLLGLHGTVMLFFALTPLLFGSLGNLLVPACLGARRSAAPWLSHLGGILLAAGGSLALSSPYVPRGGALAGWTSYPPLSLAGASPGVGPSLFLGGVVLAAAGALCNAFNLLATIALRAAPGMRPSRWPAVLWGFALGSLLTLLFMPLLGVASALLLAERLRWGTWFAAGSLGSGGAPVAYQHLFWLFGHPEVYLLILPVWGALTDVLAVHSRRAPFGFRGSLAAMGLVAALSALVYGHHLFTAGLSASATAAFMTLTLAISLPSAVLLAHWIATLWLGSVRLRLPLVYALCVLLVFVFGGLTGVWLGTANVDLYLHDTAFVVGHFHLVLAAALYFGVLMALAQWWPLCSGRLLPHRVLTAHALATLLLFLAVFGGMFVLGLQGVPRRAYAPTLEGAFRPWHPLQTGLTHLAFSLGALQLVVPFALLWSARRGALSGPNPWDATTLEWSPLADGASVHRAAHGYELRDGAPAPLLQSEAPHG